jgi:predicted RNA-binding protein with PIN domain
VTYLIDGYNLMHACGVVRPGLPAGGLERARTLFLDWLAERSKGRAAVLRVVFDAQDAPGPSPESDHGGVRVRFAFHRTADDEIEELLAAEPQPARVTVVSNDGRIREAGRRRGCPIAACEEFVDWLIDDSPTKSEASHPPEPDKPDPHPTPDEMAAWLTAFSAPKPKR